jgi:hypothetical protein
MISSVNTADGIVGIKIKLARDIDPRKPCCDNPSGQAHHAGEFRCATCGAHRGWCSQATHNLICETVRRFGAPPEPIIVRQQQEKAMAFEQKDNTGAIFVNDRKEKDTHPDRNGSAKIGGREYYISGWLHKTKDGKPYLSLTFKPKNEAVDKSKPRAEELNDAIPF